VPFDLVEKPGVNHVFLKEVGWADWQKDPGSYYSDYDRKPMETDPNRVILHLPVADYTAAYLLAATEEGEQYSPVVSLRMGAMGAGHGGQIRYHDFSAEVPRICEKPGRLATVPAKAGNLFLVRLPLGEAIAQDFKGRWNLDVDVTKSLRLAIRRPDPARFQIRPLGLPCGVRLFGITFQLAAVQMEVASTEPGYVFNEPQVPTFRISLRRMPGRVRSCSIEATATHYDGDAVTAGLPEVTLAQDGEPTTVSLPIEVGKRGYYDLEIRLKLNKRLLLTRTTSFALLPPDGRKHRDRSPFGTWDFSGAHFTPTDPDLLGPLYVKAGLRYGMFGQPDEVRKKYGIVKGNEAKPKAEAVAEMAAKIKEQPGAVPPKRLMIFHETAISGPHVTRVPSLFTGREYRFDEAEAKKFQELWQQAEETAKAIRRHFPATEIYFGNGNPQLLEEFVRRGFPKELLGSRGNEAANFARMPETQPPDWISNGAGLWMDRQILDAHGYHDTPVRQCYEMCYPGTNPGNLGPRTQANYYIRHMMHSLAWEIPVIRAMLIADVGNSYYFSNWGSSGFCHSRPHVHPKPSYVACATLTLILDGARFSRVVPNPSPVVYAVEFRRPDGKYVTCLWTIRGTRPLDVHTPEPRTAVLTDMMGNEHRPNTEGDAVHVEISAEPVFLTTNKPIEKIAAGAAVMQSRPEGKKFVISRLDKLADWTVETGRNRELEVYSFMCPRRKGDFEYTEVDAFENEPKVLGVRPRLPVEGPVYLPMYSVLRHNQGVEIPGQPTEIGLMLNGNGGWGRIIFELEDAAGQRWISIGAEQQGQPARWMADWMSKQEFAKLKTAGLNDWNTDDPWGRSYVNFEGWRYLEFPLPGNYQGEGYHWPYSSQWRHDGDGVVKYPLTFRKLIVTIPEKALHLKDYRAVPRQEIYLKDLMVTYEPPEKAFVAP